MDFNFDFFNPYWLIALLIVVLIGIIFFIIYRYKLKNHRQTTFSLKSEIKALENRIDGFKSERKNINDETNNLRQKIENMLHEKGIREAEATNLKSKLTTQKEELTDLQKQFKAEFKNIAHKILADNSMHFTKHNQKEMQQILNPLQEKLKGFETKVTELYDKEMRDKTSLKIEIEKLYQMNEKLSTDATNLTNALRKSSQEQGAWGELILEKILETSGLRNGVEYIKQKQLTDDRGHKLRPDIILKLPDNKHIIIDSKVSIVDYEKYISARSEDAKRGYLRNHINSIKQHISTLSNKNYQEIFSLQSLDFVLMFVPIESAFSLAVVEEQSLFYRAFEKNIVIVSPTTLLATLRTIANIWRMNYQSKNVKEIVRQVGDLYDKFVGFVTDLKQTGKKLDEAHKSYAESFKKLRTGRGSLIHRTQIIKNLGIRTTRSLPDDILK